MQEDEKSLLTGLEFDGYLLTDKIGEGELGVVYLAVNTLTGEAAACKVMKSEISLIGTAVQQFVYEARTASKLEHPNVIKSISAGNSSGYYYLLMEYVDGVSLENIRVNFPEKLTLEFICDRFLELADALDYAWRNHLLTHGDIKPENILIQTDPPMLKLADLGLAKVAVNTPYHHNTIMGTPLFLAPELASGEQEKATVKSDIYSFGVMFYELVCGAAPFAGSVNEVLRCHIETEPVPVREYNADVPEKIADFIEQCLEKDPQKRPENWSSIVKFLSSLKEDEAERKRKINKLTGITFSNVITAAVAVLLLLLTLAELVCLFLM